SLGLRVPEDRHRAMVDTVLAMRVFMVLHQRLQAVDLSLLQELANLDAPRTWPLLHFFRQELHARLEQEGVQRTTDIQRGSFGNLFSSQLGMDPRILSFAIAQVAQPEAVVQEEQQLSTPLSIEQERVIESAVVQQIESKVEVIAEGGHGNTDASSVPDEVQGQEGQSESGWLADPSSQVTPQGYQTAREAIHNALAHHTPLMLEVSVGNNDYTPALLPALEWLRTSSPSSQDAQHPERLVISCANQQAARRLIETVLPRLQKTLNSNFRVVYRAEHDGYLCPHRWFGAALRRTSGELTAEQARGMAKVGLWAQQTLTGERSELNLFSQEMPAWERICSGIERIPLADPQHDTIYQRCTYRNKGYCFVSLAEERVKAADIIVTTHTGLLDDLSSKASLLADIPCRLILDADVLEEESARWSSAELEQEHLLTAIKTIGTELPNGRYQGLLALAAPSLRERGPGGLSSSPTIAKSELDSRLMTWFQSLRQACVAVERLFACYQRLLEDYTQQGTNGNGREKGKGNRGYGNHGGHSGHSGGQNARGGERNDAVLRLTGDTRMVSTWTDTERAWQQVAHRLQIVIDVVHEAEKLLLSVRGNKRDTGSSEESIVASELAALAQHLLEQKQLGQQAMALSEGDNVYWLRVPPP
ncbi:MAG TPA: hypothetical protein DHW02_13895, partial [Ktedonobacter sp.]|nr:hypothetical protein [Ktedonobacter sp.]